MNAINSSRVSSHSDHQRTATSVSTLRQHEAVDKPDFTRCIEILRHACRTPEFDEAAARRWLVDLAYPIVLARYYNETLMAIPARVDRRRLDARLIIVLAHFYRAQTGREPSGLSAKPYGTHRYAANPFPGFVQAFFAAAFNRRIGDEHFHRLLTAARKEAPDAFPARKFGTRLSEQLLGRMITPCPIWKAQSGIRISAQEVTTRYMEKQLCDSSMTRL